MSEEAMDLSCSNGTLPLRTVSIGVAKKAISDLAKSGVSV